jgi:putative intracellular protease/amidase
VNSFTNSEEKEVGLANVVPFLLESKLKERGAKFQGGKNWENKVVVSDRLITGQNPQSAAALGQKIVEVATTLS